MLTRKASYPRNGVHVEYSKHTNMAHTHVSIHIGPHTPAMSSGHTHTHTHLQCLLDTTGYVVVLLPHDVGVHDPRGGVKRVHGWIYAQLRDGTGQNSGGVKVSKGGGRGGVCQVVSWHVDGLVGGASIWPVTLLVRLISHLGVCQVCVHV